MAIDKTAKLGFRWSTQASENTTLATNALNIGLIDNRFRELAADMASALKVASDNDIDLDTRIETIATRLTRLSVLPSGMLAPFAITAMPSGWLLCDGREVSRTEYQDLFNAIGTSYGKGNNVTTFNLPDLRGRVVAGVDGSADRLSDDWANNLGGTGGADEITLTADQSGLPAHTHAGSITLKGGTISRTSSTGGRNASGPGPDLGSLSTTSNDRGDPSFRYSSLTKDLDATINQVDAANAKQPHSVVQPTMVMNWGIKI